VPTVQEARWVSAPVCTFGRTAKRTGLAGIGKLDFQPVTESQYRQEYPGSLLTIVYFALK